MECLIKCLSWILYLAFAAGTNHVRQNILKSKKIKLSFHWTNILSYKIKLLLDKLLRHPSMKQILFILLIRSLYFIKQSDRSLFSIEITYRIFILVAGLAFGDRALCAIYFKFTKHALRSSFLRFQHLILALDRHTFKLHLEQ